MPKIDWRTDLGLPQETEIIGDYYLNYFDSCLDIYQYFVGLDEEKDIVSGFSYRFDNFSFGHLLYSTMEFFIAKKYRSFNFSLEWYGNEIGELKVFACKQFGKPKTDEEFLEMCKEYNIAVEKFKSYLQDIEYTLEKRPNILLTVLGTMQADFRDFNFKIKYFDKDDKTTYKV